MLLAGLLLPALVVLVVWAWVDRVLAVAALEVILAQVVLVATQVKGQMALAAVVVAEAPLAHKPFLVFSIVAAALVAAALAYLVQVPVALAETEITRVSDRAAVAAVLAAQMVAQQVRQFLARLAAGTVAAAVLAAIHTITAPEFSVLVLARQVLAALSASSGRARHVNSRQPALGINNA